MELKVKKRDGEVVNFEPDRITSAIFKAAQSVGGDNKTISEDLSGLVQDYLYINNQDIIDIESIQDHIEKVLIEQGHVKTAKSFIIYREKRKELRKSRSYSSVIDDCKLNNNALRILQKRYLLKDHDGKIIETPREMFLRVSKYISSADMRFENEKIPEIANKFFETISTLKFLPSSANLMNAGTKSKSLFSVISLPIEDNTESIFTTLKNAAISHKSGVGTGFSFSNLRPKGDIANNNPGAASGPLSFLKTFDKALSNIKQQGKRSGANMGILRIDHPDILDFITCKERRDIITNFNLSVGITDSFMESVKNEEKYNLINPRTGEIVGQLDAKRTFDLIATMAWKNADPGIIFLDRFNTPRSNPTPKLGKIECTSPCGEQALLPYEAVVLGSINLSKHCIKDKETNRYNIDWDQLKETIHTAVHFLDNSLELSESPLEKTNQLVKSNRKIGLGIMGFTDMLIKLRTPYNSQTALTIADKLMRFVNDETREASCKLAKKRGVFPNFYESIYDSGNEYYHVRNSSRTTISPTGTISLIAGCSQSIEPLYALSYLRKTSQFEILEVNPLFEEIAKDDGFYSEELIQQVAQQSSAQNIEGIPKEIRDIFLTAMELNPEDHVKIQSIFQRHVDNGVSKTVNFPKHATVEDVREVFLLSHQLECKGITIYRDGSHDSQVLVSNYDYSVNKKAIEEKTSQNIEIKNESTKTDKNNLNKHPHFDRTNHLY